ncbi:MULTISPECIES: hypothetical protein [unclassified Leucobacter]|uniref:hypothetical protein n=1 Tax=unclassified Leucobacter TaxID=2621730 RepID=UPI0006226558|nr:hypothetical protein [Leucobacter sp. Ag1]KKI18724.1 hypothetical protein XM48_10605 [Leucobacter sp. Ag1]
MSDVAVVALISSCASVVGGLVALVGTFFGPAWLDRGRRLREAKTQAAAAAADRSDRRSRRAAELVDALHTSAGAAHQWEEKKEAMLAGTRMIAELEKGEAIAAAHVRRVVDSALAEPDDERSTVIATKGTDQLFAWLRGDLEEIELMHFAEAEEAHGPF